MAKITLFEDETQVITKTILNKNLEKTANGHVVKGKATTLDIDLHELRIVIETMGDNMCLCLGINQGGSYRVDKYDSNEVSRKKKHYQYPEGPSFMMFDFDKVTLSMQEGLDLLRSLCPVLNGCGCLCVPSCSSYLYDDGGNQLSGGNSFHIYFIVDNGSKIKEFGDIMFSKSVIDGHGWIKVYKNSGRKEIRSIFDPVVWRETNREIFEANPICCEGVNSKRLENLIEIEGHAVDIEAAIGSASFTKEDHLLYRSIYRVLCEAPDIIEASKAEQANGRIKRADKRAEKSGSPKLVERNKKLGTDDWYDNNDIFHTFLTAADFVMKEDGTEIQVVDILLDAFLNFGESWRNKSMPDPINPWKRGNELTGVPGRGIAYVRISEDGVAKIFSYYGYVEYHLVWDYNSILNYFKDIDSIDILDAFIDHIFSSAGHVSMLNESESEGVAKAFKEAASKFKTASKHGEDLRTLKSQFKKKVIEINETIGESFAESSNFIEEINTYYGAALVGSKFRLVSEEFEEGLLTTKFTPIEEILKYHAEKSITVGNKKQNVFQIWNNSKHKNKFESIIFEPRNDVIVKPGERRVIQQGGHYNLWKGFVADMSRATTCDKILWHIEHVWCSGDKQMYDYTLTWLSKIFQEPWRTNMPFLVLASDQGAGKSAIVDNIIVELLGEHGFTTYKKENVIGRFNSMLSTNVFAFFDETFFSGDHEAAGILKSFVNKKRVIERKGLEPVQTRNYSKGILASNNANVTRLDLKERRFVYLPVSNKMADNSEYFEKLLHEIDNGGKEAFLDFMLKFESDINVGANNIEDLNHSAGRLRDKLHSAHPIVKMCVHIFTYGLKDIIGEVNLDMKQVSEWEDKSLSMTFEQFMDLFKNYCDKYKYEFKHHGDNAMVNIVKLKGLYANQEKSPEFKAKCCIERGGSFPNRTITIKPRKQCYAILGLYTLEGE